MPKPKSSIPVKTGGYFRAYDGQVIPNVSTTLNMFSYDEMRNHPTLMAGLSQIKYPITAVDWFITGAKETIKKDVEFQLRKIWVKLIRDILTGFDYGFAPFQKVFTPKDDKLLINFRPLKPHYIKILVDKNENFAGLRTEWDGQNKDLKKVESCVYSYNSDFNNAYGLSRLRSARYPYNVSKFIIEMTSMFYESYGDPRFACYTPEGKSKNPVTGEIVDNITYVSEVLDNLNNGGGKHITLPSKKDGEAQFKIEVLESSRTGADYLEYLNYLDARMLQAILVPTMSVMPSERGSFAMMKELTSMFAYQFDSELATIQDFINKEWIDDYVAYNYGEKHRGKYEWQYTPMTKKDGELLRQIALSLVQSNKNKPNIDWLSQQLGLPLEEIEQEAMKEITNPNPVEPPVDENNKPTEVVTEEVKMSKHIHLESQKRELTMFEKKVNFDKLRMLFDSERTIVNKLDAVVDDIKQDALAQSKKILASGDAKALEGLELKYQDKYRNLYVAQSLGIYEQSLEEASKELRVPMPTITKEVKQAERLKALQVADKNLNDMKFNIKNVLLAGLVDGDVWGDVENTIKNTISESKSSIEKGVSATIRDMITDSRDYATDNADIKVAIWSAVLDEKTCPVCEALDNELVVELDSPEYQEYSPSKMHLNCRCIWVYVTQQEENPPSPYVPSLNAKDKDKYIRR